MATHSSVLARRIPGTEEPGGLPTMGSHRVGHDWSDLAAAAAKEAWLSWGFAGGALVKHLPVNVGDTSSILGSGRSSGEGNGNLLHYSCLENLLDRGAWQAIVHGVAKSQTWLKELNWHTCACLGYTSSVILVLSQEFHGYSVSITFCLQSISSITTCIQKIIIIIIIWNPFGSK